MTPKPLTPKQAAIYTFIAETIAGKRYAPSLEEIGRRFGLSSLATIHKHLTCLEHKGYIRRDWNRARSIKLLVPANTCPTCGQGIPTDESVLPNVERRIDRSGGQG